MEDQDDGAHAHRPDTTVASGHLVEVADGVHAWMQPDGTWWLNNAGAVTGGDGTLVIDTCATETRTRRFLDAVDAATGGAPVRFAVNTHEHGDHTFGNSLLPADAALIGHEVMREHLLVDPLIDGCPPAWDPVPHWGAVTRRVPTIVIRTDLTVHSGSRRIDLVHPGYAAPTGGDLGGVLADHERYYRFVLDLAAHGRREGLGPLELARGADLGSFGRWSDAERLVLNLHRACADAEGRPMDAMAAMLDAMAWRGGPLTTHVCCLA